MIEDDKVIMDVAAAGTVVATLAGWLPVIAAALAIVWYVIRILETDTAKAIFAKLRGNKETPNDGTKG